MSFLAALTIAATLLNPQGRTQKDSVSRIIDRVPRSNATFSIANTKREAELLLLDTTIVLQMSGKGLNHVDRGIKKDAQNDGAASKFLKSVLAGSVKSLLDHGIEYNLRYLKQARVDKGVLVLEDKEGKHIFEGVDVNDEKVMTTFSESDAKSFALRVNRAIAAMRAKP